jgi:hypothetical protein
MFKRVIAFVTLHWNGTDETYCISRLGSDHRCGHRLHVADVTTKFEQMVDKNDEILNILSSSHNKKAGLSTLLLLTVTTSTIAVGSRVGLSVGSAWQPIRTKINQDDDKHDRRRILFCCRMIFSIQWILTVIISRMDGFRVGSRVGSAWKVMVLELSELWVIIRWCKK